MTEKKAGSTGPRVLDDIPNDQAARFSTPPTPAGFSSPLVMKFFCSDDLGHRRRSMSDLHPFLQQINLMK